MFCYIPVIIAIYASMQRFKVYFEADFELNYLII